MAWKHQNGTRPNDAYPMHKGEYYGNHLPPGDSNKFALDDASNERTDCYHGVPRHPVKGLVAIYLKESRKPFSWEQEIPTPPELMEPGKEHLYNINGKPGLQ